MALDMQPVVSRFALTEHPAISELQIPELWQNHGFGQIAEVFGRDQAEVVLHAPDNLIAGITPQNQHFAQELAELVDLYTREEYENGTLFTLQTCGIGTVAQFISALELERMSLLGETVWEGRKLIDKLVAIEVGVCSYFEQLAYVRGDIPGMLAPNALLISGRVITSDDQLVFARRQSKYSMGQIGIPGGTYNIEEIAGMSDGRYPYPEDVMLDEAVHELGLQRRDIGDIGLRAILYDNLKTSQDQMIQRPVLLHDVQLNLTGKQVLQSFHDSPDARKEHSELILVSNQQEEITRFMQQHGPQEFHAPADLILGTALLRTSGKSQI